MMHSIPGHLGSDDAPAPARREQGPSFAARQQVEAWFAIHGDTVVASMLEAITPYLHAGASLATIRRLVEGHLSVIVSATLTPPSVPLHVRGIGMNIADLCGGQPSALTRLCQALRRSVSEVMPAELGATIADAFEDVLTGIAWGYAVSGEELELVRRAAARPHQSGRYEFDPDWLVAVADQSPFALAIFDVSRGRLIAGNAALAAMFGYTLEEFDAIPDSELMGPETPDVDGDVFIQLATGEVSHVRRMTAFRHKDGHMVWFEMLAWLIRDTEGVPRQIAYTYTPQDDLIGVNEHWQYADTRFRHLSQVSPDPLFLVGPDGRIRYASPAIAPTLGLGAGDAVDMDFAELVLDDDREQVAQLFDTRDDRSHTQKRRRARVMRRDGEWRWFELSAVNMLDVPGLGGFTVQARDISERVAVEAMLSRQALVDELTGLPNRRAAVERVEAALAREVAQGAAHRLCVMFLDLNGFKAINDRFGHQVGDTVLAEIGRRLLEKLGEHTFIARFGGDEFLACIDETSQLRAIRLARRLIRRVSEPIDLDGEPCTVSAEVGLVMSDPAFRDAAALVRAADLALYAAKATRDGNPVVYAPGMGAPDRTPDAKAAGD